MQFRLSSKVNFFFDGVTLNLKNRKRLKRFIGYIFEKEKCSLKSINYIFSTDKALHKINKKYLNHNTLTDIITFCLSDKNQPVESDVYISVERVIENAVHLRTSFREELHRVMFHGALHLCGFTDKTKSQKAIMTLKEDFYLSKYFV
jgi:rRNA maturation RNase YbeY